MERWIDIPWNRLLRRTGQPVYYRICSERMAWRKIDLTGAASFDSLENAIYEERGTIVLFGNGAYAANRRKLYSKPLFVIIWVNDQPWALIVENRVGALVARTEVEHLEAIKPKEAKQESTIQSARRLLAQLHGNAESHVLINPDERLTDWSGPIGLKSSGESSGAVHFDAGAERELMEHLEERTENDGPFSAVRTLR